MTVRVNLYPVKAVQMFSIHGLEERNAHAIAAKLSKVQRPECLISAEVQREDRPVQLVENGVLKEVFTVLAYVTWEEIPLQPLDDVKIMEWIRS